MDLEKEIRTTLLQNNKQELFQQPAQSFRQYVEHQNEIALSQQTTDNSVNMSRGQPLAALFSSEN